MTAEKSREILDELVKKGELTDRAMGKVLNQELKHNIKRNDQDQDFFFSGSSKGRYPGYSFETFTGAACRAERTDSQDGSTEGRRGKERRNLRG